MTWKQVYVKAEREVLAEADTSRGRRDGFSCHGFSVERFHQSHYGSVLEHYFYFILFYFILIWKYLCCLNLIGLLFPGCPCR